MKKQNLFLTVFALSCLCACTPISPESSNDSSNQPSEESSSEATSSEELSSEITDRVSTYYHFSELEKHNATSNVPNGNFENGDLSHWYKKTEDAPFMVCSDDVDIWNNSVSKEGQYFLGLGASNYSGTVENKTGIIRSSLFVMADNNLITFKLAGSNQANIKCKLMKYNESGSHEQLFLFNNCHLEVGNLSGFIMIPYYIYVPEQYHNDYLYLELEDSASSNFAFINIDAIEICNNPSSKLFVSDSIGYIHLPDCNEIVKDYVVESISVGLSGKRYYKLGEEFDEKGLLVTATYTNGISFFINKNDYFINKSNYNKNQPGTYEIEIMTKKEMVTTRFSVTVLENGQDYPGLVTVDNSSSLLLIGDSQMDLWSKAKDDIGTFNVVNNIALGGSQTSYWLEQIDNIKKFNPTHILLNIGGNDIRNGGLSIEELESQFRQLLSDIHKVLPNTHIFLYSVSRGLASFYNYLGKMEMADHLYDSLDKEFDYLTFIYALPFFIGDNNIPVSSYYKTDNLHYSNAGYQILAKELNKKIKRI